MGDGLGRMRGAALAAAAIAALAVTPASAACATQVTFPDGWTRIDGPRFTTGPAELAAYDVADTVGRLVVTNGAAIAASTDDGCTWTEATIASESPLPDPLLGEQALTGRNIRQVRFPEFGSGIVWAIGDTYVANGGVVSPQPRVLFSADGGRNFGPAITGLPEFGHPVSVAGFAGGWAVLLFENTVPLNTYSLFETTNGSTWKEVWTSLPAVTDVSVDLYTQRVWLWGELGLLRGKTSESAPVRIDDISGGISALDVNSVSKTVTAFVTGGSERYESLDAGLSFDRRPSPEGVTSASSFSLGAGFSVMATSSLETNVLVEPPLLTGKKAVDFSPHEENVSAVQFVGAFDPNGFPLYAISSNALYSRVIPLDFLAPPPREQPVIDVDVEARDVDLPKPTITPARNTVRLRQGQRKVVDYDINLPPVPTPLDVFFMTDSTSSMSSTIASVQDGVQGIIDRLTHQGIDVHFGVADFRDYAQNPSEKDNYPYNLGRKVGPINDRLADALANISTGGGTTDGDDSALEAIYQGATGAGRLHPISQQELIAPGQDAGFRKDSMKVILVASDDGMRQPVAVEYPGPTLATVRSALVERGIYVVGLEVASGSGDSPRVELEDLATATGAVAPAAGIDCDGDKVADVLPQEPLVCEFDPDAGSYVADAFVSMLSAIEDIAPVDLAVTGAPKFVRPKPKTQLSFPTVNVKAENSFTLPVEFVCGPANAGARSTVRIAATSRGAEVAATTATLDCLAPPADPPVIPPALAFAPVVVPAAPLAPVSNPQPPVNTNPNPNPQFNPQAGAAAQEDQEFQLAVANNDGIVPDEDLAMSALDRPGPPMPALAWVTAFAMTGAAAFGLRRSRRTSPATVPTEYR